MDDFKKCSILEDVPVTYTSSCDSSEIKKKRPFREYNGNFDLIEYTCPNCRERLCGKHERANFCSNCGQPILWD